MIRNEHVSVLHNKGSSWDHFISSLCLVHPRTFFYVNVWGDFSQSYRILDPPPFFKQGSYSVPAAFWKYLKTIREFQREIQTIPDLSEQSSVCVWLLMLSSLWENLMDSYHTSVQYFRHWSDEIKHHRTWGMVSGKRRTPHVEHIKVSAPSDDKHSTFWVARKMRVLILVLFST